MTEKRINYLALTQNPKNMTIREIELLMAQCAGFVKMMMGAANNAALVVMMDCLNKIADVRPKDEYMVRPCSPHPKYKHKVKRDFARAIDEYKRYRTNLVHPAPDTVRFFRLQDMPDEARRKYGVVTDMQYFEFWEATGALVYQKSQPLIGSLQNKFFLSMRAHGVPYADLVAWGLVAETVLKLAVNIFEQTMCGVNAACEGLLSESQIWQIYAPFSLERISAAWQRALVALAPETDDYSLDEAEERNVALGVEQLEELWTSTDLPFDATIKAVYDYSDEIFATKGFAKKAVRELTEMRNDAVREAKKNSK